MFRFAEPSYFYLLLLLPILVAIYYWGLYVKRKNLKKYGEYLPLDLLAPDLSHYKTGTKFWIQFAAVALLIVVIAGPQFGSKLETVKKQGVEILIALDVSNSMMAKDVQPNRLERAKQILSKLVDELDNDKVGLVVFAGDAFTQLPITADYVSAKMFLSSINPGMVPMQGTAIGSALQLAMRSFTPNEKSEKAIILITDSENHEDDAIEMAKMAADKNIKVDVIGVGLPQGAPIPLSDNTSDFRKDNDGNVVITKLNEEMAQQIAQAGKGLYVRADNTNSALRAITKDIKSMNKTDMESKVFAEYDEQYQNVALFVLLLLVLDIFILNRKNRLMKKFNFFQ